MTRELSSGVIHKIYGYELDEKRLIDDGRQILNERF